MSVLTATLPSYLNNRNPLEIWVILQASYHMRRVKVECETLSAQLVVLTVFLWNVTSLWPQLLVCFRPHFLPSLLILRRFSGFCRGHQGCCIIDEPLDLAFVKAHWCVLALLSLARVNRTQTERFFILLTLLSGLPQFLFKPCERTLCSVVFFFSTRNLFFMTFRP